jgi:hypothetical protein
MNDWELPDELERLEGELCSLPQPDAPRGLQAAVLRNVRVQLRRRRRRRTCAYAACLAMGVAAWANLSVSAARETDYRLCRRADRQTALLLEDQLRALLPDLDPRDVEQHAIKLWVASELRLRPALPAGPVSRNRSNEFLSPLP